MNILMMVIIGAGIYSAATLRRETFPNFDLDMIMVSVPYPGATPEEVENGICQKIEEALQAIEGIRKMTATANEGGGMVLLELHSNVRNPDRVLNEIKEAVDRIPSFPELAENRVVQRIKIQETIISIGVLGPQDDSVESALALRQVAEDLRMELLQYPRISMVNLVGTKDYQIDIEFPENKLREYNMTLNQAASIVRVENIQAPGGTLRAPSQEINVRTDNRRYDGEGIGKLPFITNRDGTVIRLDEVANIRDEFVDGHISATVYTPPAEGIPKNIDSIAGRHTVALSVQRNPGEDLLAMVADVREFVDKKNQSGELPEGYSLITWGGMSHEVKARLDMLFTNGLQGLVIVFIMLTLFLEIRLAFWVAMGIPFSICAAMLVINLQGLSLDMITMFAFIMGIGIVVDDAIIAGENVYRHREMGKNHFKATIDGIYEVCPAVVSSVVTTMIALAPLLFVSGTMGKILYLIPLVLIAMLTASLIESFTILPCHLAHRDNLFLKMVAGYLYIFHWVLYPLNFCRRYTDMAMFWTIDHVYMPSVRLALANRLVFVTASCCVLALSIAAVYSGMIPFAYMPKMDSNIIQANVEFPNGTPAEVSEKWTKHLEKAFWQVAKEYEDAGTPVAVRSFRVVGTSLEARGFSGPMRGAGGGNSSTGAVTAELIDSNNRSVSSAEIITRWREAAGVVPGAEKVIFESQMFGPSGGTLDFVLQALPGNIDQLESAVAESRAYLAAIEGTSDIRDNNVAGKYEFRMKIKDKAKAMGIHPGDLANVIRSTYYGAEVQRLQRGRHEVKVMVCYPREDRRSLEDFNEIRIRTPGGDFPITELADIEVVRGYSSIIRLNQMRAITVTSDIDQEKNSAQRIIADMEANFLPELLKKYSGVSLTWEGDQRELREFYSSLTFLFSLAMCAMFALLTIQFRSYAQPFIVMAVIPFGWIGVVLGHWICGWPIMIMSAFGFVALSGVVVNDSILMIDFFNRRIREGKDVYETLVKVGGDRFRPIFLTSITTFGALLPILLESSLQAKIIVPMALSLAGGVAFSLFFVLLFIPVLYSYYTDFLKWQGMDLTTVIES